VSKLANCFVEALGISPEQVTDDLAYQSVPRWDSVGHMALVASIEDAFGVTLDTNDIIAMSTFARAREILQNSGINISAA